jgi:hypothetical protein
MGKHRRKRPGVEDDSNRRNLVARDVMPLRDECRAGRSLGHHVVQEAHIVSIDKHLLHLDSLDDGMQLFERFQVRLGRLKGLDRSLERQMVVQVFPCGDKVAFAIAPMNPCTISAGLAMRSHLLYYWTIRFAVVASNDSPS